MRLPFRLDRIKILLQKHGSAQSSGEKDCESIQSQGFTQAGLPTPAVEVATAVSGTTVVIGRIIAHVVILAIANAGDGKPIAVNRLPTGDCVSAIGVIRLDAGVNSRAAITVVGHIARAGHRVPPPIVILLSKLSKCISSSGKAETNNG